MIRRKICDTKSVPPSSDYRIIEGPEDVDVGHGWRSPLIAGRQHEAFAPLMDRMYRGEARIDFRAAAEAVRLTEERDPLILEVGCGEGLYSEILPHLLKRPVRYIGLDYAETLVARAGRTYGSRHSFAVGNGAELPFCDGVVDILFNGTALMHMPRYREAIQESVRVSRRWCVFHTVTVLQRRQTTLLSKRAYGQPVLEVVFNEGELLALLRDNGLNVKRVLNSLEYDLYPVLGEHTVSRTYVCGRNRS